MAVSLVNRATRWPDTPSKGCLWRTTLPPPKVGGTPQVSRFTLPVPPPDGLGEHPSAGNQWLESVDTVENDLHAVSAVAPQQRGGEAQAFHSDCFGDCQDDQGSGVRIQRESPPVFTGILPVGVV